MPKRKRQSTTPKKPPSKGLATDRTIVTRSKTQHHRQSIQNLQQSPLLRLPKELLQNIMLRSMNYQMAHACKHLHDALDSDYLRKELVVRVLSYSDLPLEDMSSSSFDIGTTHRRGRAGFDDYSEDLEQAQSNLLGVHWLSTELLQSCQQQFISSNLEKLFSYFFKHCPQIEGSSAREDFQTWVEQVNNDIVLDGPSTWQLRDEYHRDNQYQFERSIDQATLKIWLFKDYAGRPCTVYVKGSVQFQDTGKGSKFAGWTFSMPRILPSTLVPDSIIQGPWTLRQAELLRYVTHYLNRACEMYAPLEDMFIFDKGVASDGLVVALETHCEIAAMVLSQQDWELDMHFDECGEYWRGRDFCQKAFDYAQHNFLYDRGFGVSIKQYHLRDALDWDLENLKHVNGDAKCSYPIFAWLLHCAMKQDKERALQMFSNLIQVGASPKRYDNGKLSNLFHLYAEVFDFSCLEW